MPTATPRVTDPLIMEIDQETIATRRLLERVPEDKLSWKPHPKSMSLGQLALHVATVPGALSGFLETEGFDVNDANFTPDQPATKAQVLTALDESVATAKQRLGALDGEKANSPWRLANGDREIFTIPKMGLARSLMCNHWYHHRGQLTVYLRLLDVPVPATYGRSADENPFA